MRICSPRFLPLLPFITCINASSDNDNTEEADGVVVEDRSLLVSRHEDNDATFGPNAQPVTERIDLKVSMLGRRWIKKNRVWFFFIL